MNDIAKLIKQSGLKGAAIFLPDAGVEESNISVPWYDLVFPPHPAKHARRNTIHVCWSAITGLEG